MAHRTVLTARQRAELFDLPTDEASLLQHYTLADDDIEHIAHAAAQKTRSVSRFSFVPFAIPADC